MKGDEIAEAPQLRKVDKSLNDKITLKHLEGFTDVGDSTSSFVRPLVAMKRIPDEPIYSSDV